MNAQNQTENLTIHHKVKDYAAWRKGYDDHERPAGRCHERQSIPKRRRPQ